MDKKEEAIVETATEKVSKFKGFFQKIKSKLGAVTSSVGVIMDNEKNADGVMRWPRPVAFFLITIMFVVGWFHPATLLAFAQAISALPDHFFNIVYIILGSIGVTKFSKDMGNFINKK